MAVEDLTTTGNNVQTNGQGRKPGRILIVDDEPYIISALTRLLRPLKLEIFSAGAGGSALAILENTLIDVILLDVRLPDISGLEVLRQAKRIDPETVVVIMTGHGTIQTAVEAMKNGAFEFLTKPFESNDLVPLTVERALEFKRLHETNRELRGIISGRLEYKNLVADSAAMQRILRLVERLAQIDSTILITGETGTGKEVIARAVHFSGPRRTRSFVPVDCGSIPAGIIESELFGHVKGSFTGATSNYDGQLKAADQGTAFLDEVGELPLEMQSRLLRFLQEREVRPVGGTGAAKVDVRVIAATNRDLTRMVADGKFREDLYYRLNVVNIHIPPLRERPEDLPALIQFKLDKYNARLNSHVALSHEAYESMTKYSWPGNVRELENVILQALSLCLGHVVQVEDLPPALQSPPPVPNNAPAAQSIPVELPLSFEAYEKLAIERAIHECRGNIGDAAKLLDVGKSTLYRKISNMGINFKDSGKL